MIKELQSFERSGEGRRGAEATGDDRHEAGSTISWPTSRRKNAGRSRVTTFLAELGFDSLMFTELAAAPRRPASSGCRTRASSSGSRRSPTSRSWSHAWAQRRRPTSRVRSRESREGVCGKVRSDDNSDIRVPQPLVTLGRSASRRRCARCTSACSRPIFTAVRTCRRSVATSSRVNHELSTPGSVKFALGDQGEALVALGAKDYFFDDPVRRMYFENFTNVVPMERHGSLRESLRLAVAK